MGAQFHCLWPQYTDSLRDAVLTKLAAAPVTWVRIDVDAGILEGTDKDAWDEGYVGLLDRCVENSRAHGLNILVTLWNSPRWATIANPSDYADAASWLATRYRGRIQAYEVWNEPNNSDFFSGTAAQYVALLKAAYARIKAADSSALVVFGSVMYNDASWISNAYAAGARGNFDILSTHPYQGNGTAGPEHGDHGVRHWYSHLPAVRQVMTNYGDSKPVWFTEWGWSAHANQSGTPSYAMGVTEAVQADYAVRAIDYARSHYSYVTTMFWYKERSCPPNSSLPSWLSAHLEGYGLLREDGSERPVYGALRRYLGPRQPSWQSLWPRNGRFPAIVGPQWPG